MQISSLPCLWIHWATLASEWLRSQDDPQALFFFITQRLGEPFEFRMKRVAETTPAIPIQSSYIVLERT